jgi:3-oxoacyl-[acyl-carrier-protein] synthase I
VGREEMKKVWAVADTIISPLGNSTRENFSHLSHGHSGIKPLGLIPPGHDIVLAGLIDDNDEDPSLTTFETICVRALSNLLASTTVDPSKTLLILSTTKGNIELLEKGNVDHPRLHLPATAEFLQSRFNFKQSIVVSNACVSGVLAIIVGKRYIENGIYDNVVVLGADVLSKFIITGFQSLLALSNEPCRPFDEHRKGINLGEGAGAVLLTSQPDQYPGVHIRIVGAGSSNDANHISGPSRTGEELALAVGQALRSAEVRPEEIDFISAHGTATLYNDEMESKAFRIAELSDVPLHSLKGYYGHSLGAAGVIETIIGMESLRQGVLIPCLGYSMLGVSQPLNVITHLQTKELKTFLKTSSGFGGCNAAIVLEKASSL